MVPYHSLHQKYLTNTIRNVPLNSCIKWLIRSIMLGLKLAILQPYYIWPRRISTPEFVSKLYPKYPRVSPKFVRRIWGSDSHTPANILAMVLGCSMGSCHMSTPVRVAFEVVRWDALGGGDCNGDHSSRRTPCA